MGSEAGRRDTRFFFISWHQQVANARTPFFFCLRRDAGNMLKR